MSFARRRCHWNLSCIKRLDRMGEFLFVDNLSENLDKFSKIPGFAKVDQLSIVGPIYSFCRLPVLRLQKEILSTKVEIDQLWQNRPCGSLKNLWTLLPQSYAFDYIIIYLYVDIIQIIRHSLHIKDTEQEWQTKLTKGQERKSNLNGIVAIVYRFCENSKLVVI